MKKIEFTGNNTKQEILSQMDALLDSACDGETVVMMYSGPGRTVRTMACGHRQILTDLRALGINVLGWARGTEAYDDILAALERPCLAAPNHDQLLLNLWALLFSEYASCKGDKDYDDVMAILTPLHINAENEKNERYPDTNEKVLRDLKLMREATQFRWHQRALDAAIDMFERSLRPGLVSALLSALAVEQLKVAERALECHIGGRVRHERCAHPNGFSDEDGEQCDPVDECDDPVALALDFIRGALSSR